MVCLPPPGLLNLVSRRVCRSFVAVEAGFMGEAFRTFLTGVRLPIKMPGVHMPDTVPCARKHFQTKMALKSTGMNRFDTLTRG